MTLCISADSALVVKYPQAIVSVECEWVEWVSVICTITCDLSYCLCQTFCYSSPLRPRNTISCFDKRLQLMNSYTRAICRRYLRMTASIKYRKTLFLKHRLHGIIVFVWFYSPYYVQQTHIAAIMTTVGFPNCKIMLAGQKMPARESTEWLYIYL